MNASSKGFVLPLLSIIIVIILALTYFFGWIVILCVVALVLLIAGGTAIYDKVTHEQKCRYCNKIKNEFLVQRGIEQNRITTQHMKDYSDHMLIQTYIDGKMDALVNIDYNEEILDSRKAEKLEVFTSSGPFSELFVKCRAVLFFDSMEEYKDAINALTEHLKDKPKNGVALNNRALAHWETGNIEDALVDFKQSARYTRHDHYPFKNWGMLLEKQGQIVEAIKKYNFAIKIAPDDPYLLRTRAHGLIKLERYSEAIEDFTKAIKLQHFKQTHLDRADVYEKLGKYKEAKADRIKASKLTNQ